MPAYVPTFSSTPDLMQYTSAELLRRFTDPSCTEGFQNIAFRTAISQTTVALACHSVSNASKAGPWVHSAACWGMTEPGGVDICWSLSLIATLSDPSFSHFSPFARIRWKLHVQACVPLRKGSRDKLSHCTQLLQKTMLCKSANAVTDVKTADSPLKVIMAFMARMCGSVGRADLVHLIPGGGTQAV